MTTQKFQNANKMYRCLHFTSEGDVVKPQHVQQSLQTLPELAGWSVIAWLEKQSPGLFN